MEAIHAGFNEDRSAYFARSKDGLWVRSLWDLEKGEIEVAWQERYVSADGKIMTLDENAAIIAEEDVRFAVYRDDPWVVAGVVKIDRPGFISFARKQMARVIESIMIHSAKLIALGFGDSAEEVAGWFARPEDGLFVVATEYVIEDGVGMFHGADGMVYEVENLENEVLTGKIIVPGHESYELSGPLEIGVLREFLVSTIPT